uniref:TEPSIN adaptor related protein complex 4 accessory protein n=1 Tax=Nothoprocta perdicaria TaxID=30464 RepID=A0A8C6ZDD6_NOTPE
SVMAAPLRDRLSFLSRLPALLKGTADDDAPCPGYLLDDIARISHESPGSSQCLLEYLLQRLQSRSCRVKLKVLKILLHTCARGSPRFALQLRSNAAFVREAAVFTGPPDPLHGNGLNQKVRAAAQVGIAIMFPLALVPPGMGSKSSSNMQGFGFSTPRGSRLHAQGGRLGLILSMGAVGLASSRAGGQRGRSAGLRAPVPAARHQPGLPGGGWEEPDSGHSSQDSWQGNGERGRASDSCSKSGSDSLSGAKRGAADADGLGDCVREVGLVRALTRGARVFLTREEAQLFVKECALLNCEVVLELLGRALEDRRSPQRSLCAVSALMCSDLLSLEHIHAATRQRLQQLSQGSPGPVANRATKVTAGASPRALSLRRGPQGSDLLTDTPPPPGQGLLEPVSAVPPAPGTRARPCAAGTDGPEPRSGLAGTAGDAAPARSLSLFAGMELVARPGTVLPPDCPPAAPRTLCPAGDTGAVARPDAGGTAEPSAFPFLNM